MAGELQTWLDAHADALDGDNEHAEQVVPRLAAAGLFGIGVPAALGGSGGDVRDAIEAVASVAEQSLTAAFVFWGQRTFIEYLLHTPNQALAEREAGALVRGERAGATGLSNAMKFLSGIEALQISAAPQGQGWRLNGSLAWVSNLRKGGYVAAAAVASSVGAPPMIVSLDGDLDGVQRSADLDLMALRASNTAAIRLQDVRIDPIDVIHSDARAYLPAVRPGFLGLQCGLSIGLARTSLRAARAHSARAHSSLANRIDLLEAALAVNVDHLLEGVHDGRFKSAAAPLFRIRIGLADIVQQAASLELQASGGRAYLQHQDQGFARRWREAAFVPIVTPSLTQLQAELHKQAGQPA